MRKDSIESYFAKIILKKQTTFNTEEGYIHPIVEATVALVKNQITDSVAINYLTGEIEDKEIRAILAIDYILASLKEEDSKKNIRSMLDQRKSLDNILEHSALYLSKDKALKDNNIYVNMKKTPLKIRKYIAKKIRRNNPHFEEVYIKKSSISELEKEMKLYRTSQIRKNILLGGVAAIVIFSSCHILNKQHVQTNKKNHLEYKMETIIK